MQSIWDNLKAPTHFPKTNRHSADIYNDVAAVKYLCLMALDYLDSAKPTAEDKAESAVVVLEKVRDIAQQIGATLDTK